MKIIPTATYRIQFNNSFGFGHLQEIIPYLKDLGISTVYASPIFSAIPGSMHGYDVTDPMEINPEIGSFEEFRLISNELRRNGISWLQDIVPNHMAFSGNNHWLEDFFERGQKSQFARFFDIDHNHPDPELNGRLMAPFLGKSLKETLADGEISIFFDNGFFKLNFPGDSYSLSIESLRLLLENFQQKELTEILSRYCIEAKENNSWKDWQLKKQELAAELIQYQNAIEKTLKEINKHKEKVSAICALQNFSLCYWKESHVRINFRRFFTVNALLCLAIEKEENFNFYHQFILKLYQEGLIHGLRIDHIDGLKNPGEYLRRIKKIVGEDLYLIVEKILTEEEKLSPLWKIDGTSGYEFLSFVNQALTDKEGAARLLEFYKQFTGENQSFKDGIYEAKKSFLHQYMQGELDNLTMDFSRLLDGALAQKQQEIRKLLSAFMCAMPVYRIYPESYPLEANELKIINIAFQQATARETVDPEMLTELKKCFSNSSEKSDKDARRLSFIQRLMQFTGPLTAKGVEDTVFYRYNPLIAHNEVGDSPATLGKNVDEFHQQMSFRQQHHPFSLNATATHDTKRGEDARMRIGLLSGYAEEWCTLVEKWAKLYRLHSAEKLAVSGLDQYFIYQSILGGFPEQGSLLQEFSQRLKDYLRKAFREAKLNTNWDDPNDNYENAVAEMVDWLMQPDSEFLKTFLPFFKKICAQSAIYSLSQSLIKLTAPGIPDIYQGAEMWDLSFVDPDNRRPVDYQYRIESLVRLKEMENKSVPEEFFACLRDKRSSGLEKLFLYRTVLKFRQENPLLFIHGDYIPLPVYPDTESALAYCRYYRKTWVMTVCPLKIAGRKEEIQWMHAHEYQDIIIRKPAAAPSRWINRITGEVINMEEQISVGTLLTNFPVALLTSAEQ